MPPRDRDGSAILGSLVALALTALLALALWGGVRVWKHFDGQAHAVQQLQNDQATQAQQINRLNADRELDRKAISALGGEVRALNAVVVRQHRRLRAIESIEWGRR